MKTLILVDLQNDFMPGGPLAVPDGNDVVPVANALMPLFDLVVATQDWHPPDHCSFASQYLGKSPGDQISLGDLQQVLWPDHCIEGSQGAALVAELEQSGVHRMFRKGTDRKIDSYSGFFDNGHRKSTELSVFLQDRGATDVYVMGLATDYCVKFTALDAVQLGFHTQLISDGCRGVELRAGDCRNAIEEMMSCGVVVCNSRDILARSV